MNVKRLVDGFVADAHRLIVLLAEIDAEEGKVRLVARRHGISESLLYNWRSARKAAVVATGARDDVRFVPVGVVAGKAPHRQVLLVSPEQVPTPELPPADGKGGSIEITLPNGARVSVDAFVDDDLRNGFDGLAAKAQQVIGADPFSGHLFIFRGKRGDYFKGLYWDGTRMWLTPKRLEKGRFVCPPIVDGLMSLTPAQFSILVKAMDWRRTIAPPPPTQPMLV